MGIEYASQNKPEGVAQGILIAKSFINNNPSALILGDNIFHGNQLIKQFSSISDKKSGATVLACPVSDPERYGVVEFDNNGDIINIELKPPKPESDTNFQDEFIRVFSIITSTLTTILLVTKL